MSNISEIDKNFLPQKLKDEDVIWVDSNATPFSLYGIFYDNENGEYRRVPKSLSSKVSFAFDFLSANTSGGKLRFKTNSPFIALKAEETNCGIMNHMPINGQCGFSLYIDGKFGGVIAPTLKEVLSNTNFDNPVPSWEDSFNSQFDFKGLIYCFNKEKEVNIDILFPLYGSVKKLYVGIKKGSTINVPEKYDIENPIVFYGSSITQGGCASRAGNDYVNLISNKLSANVINLGFSGNALGEKAFAEYISTLKMSVFVLDYDHNAPTLEHLKNTHYEFYKIVREKNPDLPIIILSKPIISLIDKNAKKEANDRFKVIKNTYEKAKCLGDNNVYLIDGKKLIASDKLSAITIDGIHPNDLGFYNIANGLNKIISKIIKK